MRRFHGSRLLWPAASFVVTKALCRVAGSRRFRIRCDSVVAFMILILGTRRQPMTLAASPSPSSRTQMSFPSGIFDILFMVFV
mmetsp:Transcript_130317/g.416820  ORF Transcript_130317/g.416820 Transcript_130317/m.416820 type:complete len:83 (+) Transcript_130317:639-887(+)